MVRAGHTLVWLPDNVWPLSGMLPYAYNRPLCTGRNYAQLPLDSQHRLLLRAILLRIVIVSAETA